MPTLPAGRKRRMRTRDKYLGIIHEEIGKLSKLVKELFNLAKMDENSFSIEKEKVHLFPYFHNDDRKSVLRS